MSRRLVHGYIRVSTEDQASDGLSLETQRELVRSEWERVWEGKGTELSIEVAKMRGRATIIRSKADQLVA